MTVHTEGDLNCDICNIPFTKPALLSHNRNFHPDIVASGLVEKALKRHMMTSFAEVIFTLSVAVWLGIVADGKKT